VLARDGSIEKICQFKGVDGVWTHAKNDMQAAREMLGKVEDGKHYYFAAGRHAAVIRKAGGGYEFLELQSPSSNGFFALDDDALRYRFGCRARAGSKPLGCFLIDAEKLAKSPDFIEMLKYINTLPDKQMKGAYGRVR
jgi:hypothetical protein